MAITTKCLILIFMILRMSPFQVSQATDTLLPNQTIPDGHSLISADKTFELGFFSPGISRNRYVGIWYHKLPLRAVVWVANRDRPVLDSSGILAISELGNLVIRDATGACINVGSNTGKANLTRVTLLNSGNLVLRDLTGIGNDQALWQSFDNPTDTFLPGMKLGLNGRVNRLITSWRSSDDPGVGDFSGGIDPNGMNQFFLWRRGQVHWSSGIWNGKNFSLIPEMTPYFVEKFTYVPDWSGGQFSYSFRDRSIVSRGVMEISGQFKQLVWTNSEWTAFWAEPKTLHCETPSYCGANGICSNSISPTCKCLSGFQPNSLSQWESGKWTEGCIRQASLQCGSSVEFLKLENVKLPIFSSRAGDSSMGLEGCRGECNKDCNCTAYASENANGTGCLFWSRDLLGLQENIISAQDLYVRLQLVSDKREQGVQLVIIISTIVSVIFLLSVIFICYSMRKNTKGNRETNQELLQIGLGPNPGLSNRFSDTIKGEKGRVCPFISFTTIATATNNFSASNKLGEGGFGSVYMGTLDGRTMAVKRLSRGSGQGGIEFRNEITLIVNLQHTNLVKLLGFCIEGEEKILIYEYMPNKSLDFHIFGRTNELQLDWQKRFHIIEGIAQGLLYLHKYSRLRIIHRDLKTSNILLDGEMNPKISDFGLARIFEQNENQANTRRVVGTYGYMSPEYAMDGLFSTKSDVFSFGVIILEIVSGKKATSFDLSGNTGSLPGYAWNLWKEGRGLELIDPSLGKVDPSDEVLRCIHVALLCVQERAADRPAMSDVVPMFCSESTTILTPAQPPFFIVKASPSLNSEEIHSSNDVTFTTVEGR